VPLRVVSLPAGHFICLRQRLLQTLGGMVWVVWLAPASVGSKVKSGPGCPALPPWPLLARPRPPVPLEVMLGLLGQPRLNRASTHNQGREPIRNFEQLIGYLRRSRADYTPTEKNQKAYPERTLSSGKAFQGLLGGCEGGWHPHPSGPAS
jgi:hypothetical protein